MPRVLLAISVVAIAIICSAQDQPSDPAKKALAETQIAAAIAAAGCGPSGFEFDVTGDKQQHPMPQAEPAKALIYVFEEGTAPGQTLRIGLDSKWAGATQNGTYFFFATDPGEHRLCVNAESSDAAPAGTAGTLALEAGRTYYFQVQVYGNQSGGVGAMALQQLDDANGQYMVATHSLSIPKKQSKVHDDPTYTP